MYYLISLHRWRCRLYVKRTRILNRSTTKWAILFYWINVVWNSSIEVSKVICHVRTSIVITNYSRIAEPVIEVVDEMKLNSSDAEGWTDWWIWVGWETSDRSENSSMQAWSSCPARDKQTGCCAAKVNTSTEFLLTNPRYSNFKMMNDWRDDQRLLTDISSHGWFCKWVSYYIR